MKIVGTGVPEATSWACTSKPLTAPRWTSSTRQSGGDDCRACRNASADSKVSTVKPAARSSRFSDRSSEVSSSTTPTVGAGRDAVALGRRCDWDSTVCLPTTISRIGFRSEGISKGAGNLWAETDLLGHPDQRGHRFRPHLLHHAAAVDLDRLLGSAKLARDLLVEHAGDHECEHLALTRREAVHPALDLLAFSRLGLALAAPGQRPLDGVQELLVVAGLLEKIDGPTLHGTHAHRDVTEARDEDDREAALSLAEVGLEIQPTRSSQPHVEQEARGPVQHLALHEGTGRGERLHVEAGGADQSGHRPAHGLVVVDDVHDSSAGRGSVQVPGHGISMCIVRPRSLLRVAQIRPPCAWMIERLIDRPMPSPPALLVMKRSKMRSSSDSSTPLPVSSTVISRAPGSSRMVSMLTSRRSSSAMASQALTTTFKITCWSWTTSPSTRGRSSARRSRNQIRFRSRSLPRRRVISRITSLMSSGCWSTCSFLKSARRCLTTSDARFASSAMSCSPSRISPRSRVADSMRRRVACALLTIAARGWLISWASEAASSPRVVTRRAWVSSSRSCSSSSSARRRLVISRCEMTRPPSGRLNGSTVIANHRTRDGE